MAKYYTCPTHAVDCPYYDFNLHSCAMEIMTGDKPCGQCDEYDAYTDEEEDYDDEEEEE